MVSTYGVHGSDVNRLHSLGQSAESVMASNILSHVHSIGAEALLSHLHAPRCDREL